MADTGFFEWQRERNYKEAERIRREQEEQAVKRQEQASSYVRRIRNEAKREYAEAYLRYLRGEGCYREGEPDRGMLGMMAAQGVRMELAEILGGRR